MKKSKGTLLKIISLSLSCCIVPLSLCACESQEGEAHEHVYSDVWSYDETYHWQEPICGCADAEPRGKSIHNYVKNKCSLCGYDPNPDKPQDPSPSEPTPPEEEPKEDPPEEEPGEDEPQEGPIDPVDPGDVADSLKEGRTFRDGFDYTELIDESGRLAGYAISAGEHLQDTSVTVPASFHDSPVLKISALAFRNGNLSSVSLPEGLLEIGQLAFDSCKNLTSVTMPNTVTTMGDMAFYNCSALASVRLSSSLTGIYYRAFFNCAFEELTIPDSVREIGGMAFDGCEKMRVISFGKGISSIAKQAFKDCKALSILKIPDLASYLNIDYAETTIDTCPTDHVRHIIDMSQAKDDSLDSENFITEVNVEGVEKVPEKAFYQNKDIRKVTIGKGVKTLGSECFEGCIYLKSVELDDGIEVIDYMAFSGCSMLATFNFPESLKIISFRVLGDCVILSKVTIGRNVSYIDREIFLNCHTLSEVRYKGNSREWQAIQKRDGWDNMMPRNLKVLCDG